MADSVLANLAFKDHAALLIEYQSNTDEELAQQVLKANNQFQELPI